MNNFNAVIGHELVQHIEMLAAEEVEQAQKDVWASVEAVIQAEFRRRKLDLSAHETLQVLRKFDANISAKPMTIKIMESIWEALEDFRGEVSETDMPEFATFLKDEYFKGKKAESTKRVLLTHVNAALRCFRRRYVSSWQSFYGESFDVEAFAGDVDSLGERVVSDPEDLIEWAGDVVELSNRFGVDRENKLKSTRENRIISRPVGIISLSSEGPYTRQWSAWIGANADRLLLGRNKPGLAPTGDFMFRSGASQPVGVEVKKHFEKQSAVHLEVSSQVNPSIQAKTHWPEISLAAGAVAGWLSLLEVVWSGPTTELTAKLTVQTETISFSVDIPVGSLSEVGTSIEEALGRLEKAQPAKSTA